MDEKKPKSNSTFDWLISPSAQVTPETDPEPASRETTSSPAVAEGERAPLPKGAIPPVWPEQFEAILRKNWWPPYGIGGRHQWDGLVAAGEREMRDILRRIEQGLDPDEEDLWTEFMEEVLPLNRPDLRDVPIDSLLNGAQFTVFRTAPAIRALETFALSDLRGKEPELAKASAEVVSAARFMGRLFAQNTHGVLQWAHYGRRVYVIDPHTYELLARTDLPEIPCAALRAPLAAFYIRFPEGVFYLRDSESDERTEIEGILLNLDRAAAGDAPARTLALSLGVPGIPKVSDLKSTLRVTVRFAEDESIPRVSERLATALSEMYEGATEVDSIPTIALGLCLYLASAHPALEPVPPPSTRKKEGRGLRQHQAKKTARPPVSRLGYIRVGRPPENHAGADQGSNRRRLLDHQVWVRGHWRMQAHGHQWSERKLIWIEPFVKGPDHAESMQVRAGRVQRAQERGAPLEGGAAEEEGPG